MTGPIRVFVADNQLIVRRGLATLLLAFNDMVLAGEAQNGAEVLARCPECRPDVVLLGLFLPDMDSVAATRTIRERDPNIQVIVLVSLPVHELVQRALAAGAAGYLPANASAADLAAAIRGAHAGRLLPSAQSLGAMAPAAHMPELPPPADYCADLTNREHDVLALMIHGMTNTQIGAQLEISRATAKAHVSNILSKLGAASRTEAVALAVQHRLTTGPTAISAAALLGDLR